MVRLLAGSLGIMALGLIAVFAAIVYRIGQSGEADIAAPTAAREAAPLQAEAAIVLPDDTEIRSVGLDGDRALLLVGGPQGEALILVDLASGAILARRPLSAGPDDSAGR